MPSNMFGVPEGITAFDQNELVKAETAAKFNEMAMSPYRARLLSAQAAKLEEATAQERTMGDLARRVMGGDVQTGTGAVQLGGPDASEIGSVYGGQPQQASSFSAQLNTLARTAFGAGLVTKGEALAKTAALIGTRETARDLSITQAALNRLKGVRENAELTSQLLGGVNDEESWQRANALYTFQTGQPSPYAQLPYSKELVERLNQAALSAKERAELEEKGLVRKATKAYRDRRLGQIDTEDALRKRRVDVAEAREARISKTGGKPISSPSKEEQDQVARLIKKDYPNLSTAELNEAKFSIGAEAKALRRANPALDASTALQQAYNNAIQSGDFKNVRPGVLGYGAKDQYSGGGKYPTTPARIPSDKNDLKADRYYVNSQGQVGRWNGKTFEIGDLLSGDNGDPDDEADDDEEE